MIILRSNLLPGYVNPVESHDHKHKQVQTTVQHHNEQAHLNFFEEPVACLHVYVNNTRSL